MLKKHIMLVIFCLFCIFLGGCTKIKVQITLQDEQTCQNFCQITKFLSKDTNKTCQKICQTANTPPEEREKSIKTSKKQYKNKKIENITGTIQNTNILSECENICISLWPTNIQEKTTCTANCKN